MSSDPKLHHYVPQLILRRFTDNLGRLHVFNRSNPDEGVYATRPAKAFAKKHLYTQVSGDGEKDVSVELEFSKLESRAEELVEKIVSSARRRQKPGLTDAELQDWCRFTFLQWKRVPERLNPLVVENEDYVDVAIRAYEEKIRSLTDDERTRFGNPEYRRRLLRNAAALAALKPGKEAEAIMHQRGISVFLISDARRSFIIGSRPVQKYHPPGQANMRYRGVGVVFPIASDVMTFTADRRGAEVLVESANAALIRQTNLTTAGESTVFAGRSRNLVQSLARPR